MVRIGWGSASTELGRPSRRVQREIDSTSPGTRRAVLVLCRECCKRGSAGQIYASPPARFSRRARIS